MQSREISSEHTAVHSESQRTNVHQAQTTCAYTRGLCYHPPVAGKVYCDIHLCMSCGREKSSSQFTCKICSGGAADLSHDAKNLHRVATMQPTHAVQPQGAQQRRNTISFPAAEPTASNWQDYVSSWKSQSQDSVARSASGSVGPITASYSYPLPSSGRSLTDCSTGSSSTVEPLLSWSSSCGGNSSAKAGGSIENSLSQSSQLTISVVPTISDPLKGLHIPMPLNPQQECHVHIHHHHYHHHGGGKPTPGVPETGGNCSNVEENCDCDDDSSPEKVSKRTKVVRYADQAGKVANAALSVFSLVSKVAKLL